MSHCTTLPIKCVWDCFNAYWEELYPHSNDKADQHLPIKKITPVKFEFPQKFGITSPVTLVQKGLSGISKRRTIKTNKRTENNRKHETKQKNPKGSEKGNRVGLLS